MATAKKNTELAPVENFALTTAYDGLDPELAAELKDQMDDLDDESGINCRTIKIPSGGSLAFTVQGDEDGDEDYPKEIEGVIVFTHRMNGYWPNAFGSSTNPEDKIPVCSSMDGKSGLNIRTGEICECDKCPCNQYGSDPNGGKGKACKNMRRIYLMRSNDPNLYLLTVPPTSIKEVNKALTRIMASKGIPYTNLIVGFKLAKATNANGINYATVVVDKRGILPPAVAQTAKAIRRTFVQRQKCHGAGFPIPRLFYLHRCVQRFQRHDQRRVERPGPKVDRAMASPNRGPSEANDQNTELGRGQHQNLFPVWRILRG